MKDMLEMFPEVHLSLNTADREMEQWAIKSFDKKKLGKLLSIHQFFTAKVFFRVLYKHFITPSVSLEKL